MADDDPKVGVERLLFLRSLSTTRAAGPEAVQIAAAMRDVHFRQGETLFTIAEPSGEIFFLVKGSVRMTAPGAPDWRFEAPAVVGAIDSAAGRARTRTGVATSDTHALVLTHADWLAVLEDHFEFARETVRNLAGAVWRMRLAVPGDGGYPAEDETVMPGPTRLGLLDRTLALRAVPLLHAASVQVTVRLAELAEEVALGPGEALFREGDACEALDVVASGTVVAERAEPPLRAAFGRGRIVGGAAMIGVRRHAFGARAPAGAVVLRLRKDDVLDVMEDHFELTRAILGGINAERDALMSRHGVLDDRAPATRR